MSARCKHEFTSPPKLLDFSLDTSLSIILPFNQSSKMFLITQQVHFLRYVMIAWKIVKNLRDDFAECFGVMLSGDYWKIKGIAYFQA